RRRRLHRHPRPPRPHAHRRYPRRPLPLRPGELDGNLRPLPPRLHPARHRSRHSRPPRRPLPHVRRPHGPQRVRLARTRGGPTAPPETIAFRAALDVVGAALPEVADSIRQELADQRSHLKLIASENFASPAVLLAMGNWLSDKYAEGSPGHRFYAGCDNVDAIESRAVELAKSLFGAQHAYVQAHSGIDANLVAFWAVLTHRVEAPELERLNAKDVRDLSAED